MLREAPVSGATKAGDHCAKVKKLSKLSYLREIPKGRETTKNEILGSRYPGLCKSYVLALATDFNFALESKLFPFKQDRKHFFALIRMIGVSK